MQPGSECKDGSRVPPVACVLNRSTQHLINSELIEVETALDQPSVDTVLRQLWREDLIECQAVGWTGFDPLLLHIRRVIPERRRIWGDGVGTEGLIDSTLETLGIPEQ